jgi:DNA (cytosine-5)-methyltransferase 3A
MNVLSLFDGISCARVALDKLGINVGVYYASEVDPHAIKISLKNYPDIIQIGDVKTICDRFDINPRFGGGIDLLIGGSPCQDLSIAKKDRKGLDGARSGLFWEYVKILQSLKPKYFVLENVASMPKEAKATITEALGVDPIMINAGLVSAQNRKRLFWTNINNVKIPEDKNIHLKDILENNEIAFDKYGVEKIKSYTLRLGGGGSGIDDKHNWDMIRVGQIGDNKAQSGRVYSAEGKSVALQANGGGMGAKTGLYVVDKIVRKLTPIECERLQGVPDNYTEGIGNTQRYKTLGNAFNVDVIKHILSYI